jgi:hypothetical protein
MRASSWPIVPKQRTQRSPFNVPSLGKSVSRKEILAAMRESRRQSDRLRWPK